MRVCGWVKDRGGAIVRINKMVRGFRTGAGVWVKVVLGSSWDWMEFGTENATVLFFTLCGFALCITTVHPIAHLLVTWMMKAGKGQL